MGTMVSRVFRSACEGAEPAELDLETLNQVLSEELSHTRLGILERVYTMEYDSKSPRTRTLEAGILILEASDL